MIDVGRNLRRNDEKVSRQVNMHGAIEAFVGQFTIG